MENLEEIEFFDAIDIRKRTIRLNRFCVICERKIDCRSNICHDCRLKTRWDRPTLKMIEQIRMATKIAHSLPRSEKQLEHFKKIEEKGRNIAHINLSDRMIGTIGYWKDKTFSDEHKQKIANSHKGVKAYQWKGGISFEPYCVLFNFEFKERVREYWNRRCVICDKDEIENGRRLDVHHVTYNKDMCCDESIPLFVPLCCSCHMKTHFNENCWEKYFKEIIYKQNKDGKCFYSTIEMERKNDFLRNN